MHTYKDQLNNLIFFFGGGGVQYIFIEIQKIYTIIQYGYINNTSYTIKNNIVAIRYLSIIIAMRPKCPTIKRKRFSLFVYWRTL